MQVLQSLIDDAFERRDALTRDEIETRLRPALKQIIADLESARCRVSEPDGHGTWRVNQWLKKGGAVILPYDR